MGTLGWIAVGAAVGTIAPHVFGYSIETTNLPLKLGAGLSVLLGIYAFFLPATPPANAGSRPSLVQALGLATLACMKDRSFAIFIIGSALICIPLSFYYSFANVFLNETGMTGTAGKMALGQASELLFLLLIPALFARWGVTKMLLIGMAAWMLR